MDKAKSGKRKRASRKKRLWLWWLSCPSYRWATGGGNTPENRGFRTGISCSVLKQTVSANLIRFRLVDRVSVYRQFLPLSNKWLGETARAVARKLNHKI